MHKPRQLRVAEQRKRLQKYLRTLRADYNRAWRELSAIFRIRKGCPLEHQLRHRRFEGTAELLKLAEKCLEELNHCYALRLAAFRPGDQLLVKTTICGFPPDPRRYLVLDVRWAKRDSYWYEVHELTKAGMLHKGRYPHMLCPSSRVSIERCDEPLPEETRRQAEWARRASVAFLETTLKKGDLAKFLLKSPAPSRAERPYPFWVR